MLTENNHNKKNESNYYAEIKNMLETFKFVDWTR